MQHAMSLVSLQMPISSSIRHVSELADMNISTVNPFLSNNWSKSYAIISRRILNMEVFVLSVLLSSLSDMMITMDFSFIRVIPVVIIVDGRQLSLELIIKQGKAY
jgi:hypothetical protein